MLLFTTRREVRGAYQTLFARGAVHKTYLARAAVDPNVCCRGWCAAVSSSAAAIFKPSRKPGEPNAETLVELMSPDGLYRLTPRTGRTHQLRVHMASLGIPIYGDPLYPNVIDVAADDFSTPLQLLAQRIEFDDPLSGIAPRFVSSRRLDHRR